MPVLYEHPFASGRPALNVRPTMSCTSCLVTRSQTDPSKPRAVSPGVAGASATTGPLAMMASAMALAAADASGTVASELTSTTRTPSSSATAAVAGLVSPSPRLRTAATPPIVVSCVEGSVTRRMGNRWPLMSVRSAGCACPLVNAQSMSVLDSSAFTFSERIFEMASAPMRSQAGRNGAVSLCARTAGEPASAERDARSTAATSRERTNSAPWRHLRLEPVVARVLADVAL